FLGFCWRWLACRKSMRWSSCQVSRLHRSWIGTIINIQYVAWYLTRCWLRLSLRFYLAPGSYSALQVSRTQLGLRHIMTLDVSSRLPACRNFWLPCPIRTSLTGANWERMQPG